MIIQKKKENLNNYKNDNKNTKRGKRIILTATMIIQNEKGEKRRIIATTIIKKRK